MNTKLIHDALTAAKRYFEVHREIAPGATHDEIMAVTDVRRNALCEAVIELFADDTGEQLLEGVERMMDAERGRASA